MDWRLIDTDLGDPFYVTAIDDALISLKTEQTPNILHFYRRNTPTISVGRSRPLQADINLETAQQHQIHIIRRTTGGGTIYTDPGCLIYSLILNTTTLNTSTAHSYFNHICPALVRMFTTLDIPTHYKPPNDILVNNKKISGSAMRKKSHCILIHGTILVNTNLPLMNTVLKNPKTSQVSTLTQELPEPPTIQEIKNAMKKTFEHLFHTTFEPSTISKKEEKIITQLIINRYQNNTWNRKR
jgi:lipoate-protein ligase A